MNKEISKILVWGSVLSFIDQLSKLITVLNFQKPYEIIKGFFRLEYAENTGIAFSIPVPYIALIIFNVILMGAMIFLAVTELNLKKPLSKIAVALILGGGLGNLIDRLVNGYVIDFVSIWKYPSFNLADCYITIGVLLIIVFYGKIKLIKTKNNG